MNPIDQLLEKVCTLHEERVAANWFQLQQSLTYGQLRQEVLVASSGLAAIGVGTGSHVSMMLPNCPASLIAWFALARLGAVLTPINQAYGGEELHYVLADSEAEFLLIEQSFLSLLEDRQPLPCMKKVVVHGSESTSRSTKYNFINWSQLQQHGQHTISNAASMNDDHLFSIQYTSGTTGFPKGCMLTQEYWCYMAEIGYRTGVKGGVENSLIWAPFYYMDGQWQMLMTLSLGGTAFFASKMSLSKFADWLERFNIHYCTMPEPFIQTLDENRAYNWSLRMVNTFAWRAHNIAKFRRLFGCIGSDAFGMTELGGVTQTEPDMDLQRYEGSCGKVIDEYTKITIRDEQGLAQSVGKEGELWVQSKHMLLGYYKRVDANADAFVGKWFRTGDLAKVDENGYLYITGRIKEMIKRGGENIAAREVEAIIMQHPDVAEVGVVGVPDPQRREEVKAFVILRAKSQANELLAQDIWRHSSEFLAAFKLPRYIEFVTNLPRTPTGKIAKHKLRNLSIADNELAWDCSTWKAKDSKKFNHN